MANSAKTETPASFTGARETPTTEVERLREENERLRRELDEAKAGADRTAPQPAREPSFGMSEGERAELELTGKTVSPFTGEVRTSDEDK